jgi:hypothetical protein
MAWKNDKGDILYKKNIEFRECDIDIIISALQDVKAKYIKSNKELKEFFAKKSREDELDENKSETSDRSQKSL